MKSSNAALIVLIGAAAVGGYFMVKPLGDFWKSITDIPENIGKALAGANTAAQQGTANYYSYQYPVLSGGAPPVYILNADGSIKRDLAGAPVPNVGINQIQQSLPQTYSVPLTPLAYGEQSALQKAIGSTWGGKSFNPQASTIPAKTQAPATANTLSYFSAKPPTVQQSVAASFGLKTSQINPAVNNANMTQSQAIKVGIVNPVFNVSKQSWQSGYK